MKLSDISANPGEFTRRVRLAHDQHKGEVDLNSGIRNEEDMLEVICKDVAPEHKVNLDTLHDAALRFE